MSNPMPADWKQITPDSLLNAVDHIRERFDEIEFKVSFLTQQKCYKELHPFASTTTPSTIFKSYMDVYGEGLKESITAQFNDLLEIGLANTDELAQHPIEWAQSHLRLLIDSQPERVKLWIKNVCDQQPMTESTAPEDMDEFIYWRSWRAPKFIVMQPSGNATYNPHSVWEREDEEQTQKYLQGLSKRFQNGLIFHLEKIVGDGYVNIAKKGMRIQKPSLQKSAAKDVVSDGSDVPAQVPVAFISYSWDSDAHKQWVLDLAARLQAEGGVRIILDRWHLPPGGDKAVFMEKSVSSSTFVILICTPNYAERANKREGGVGYEAAIITGELAESINQGKFIPVLRDGDWKSSLPVWIKTKMGVDLRRNSYSDEQYQDLLRALHNEPLKPPPVGPKPVFRNSPRDAEQEALDRIGRTDVEEEPSTPAELRPGKRVMIRPIIPRNCEAEQFVVKEVTREIIKVDKPSSGHQIVIPRNAVDKIQSWGEFQPPWLMLSGRLQWRTRSRTWVFLPEQPPFGPEGQYGSWKSVWMFGLGTEITEAIKGLETTWALEQKLPRLLSEGWTIFYDEDGYYLRNSDRPSDQILICKLR